MKSLEIKKQSIELRNSRTNSKYKLAMTMFIY